MEPESIIIKIIKEHITVAATVAGTVKRLGILSVQQLTELTDDN